MSNTICGCTNFMHIRSSTATISKTETVMDNHIRQTALSLANPIYAFLRSVIDGPNPSEPYSWAGTFRGKPIFSSAKGKNSANYEQIC